MTAFIAIFGLFFGAAVGHSAFADPGDATLGKGTIATFHLKAKASDDTEIRPEFVPISLGERDQVSCSLYLPRAFQGRDLDADIALLVDRSTVSPRSGSKFPYITYLDGTVSIDRSPTNASIACEHQADVLSSRAFGAYVRDVLHGTSNVQVDANAGASDGETAAAAPAKNQTGSRGWESRLTAIDDAEITELPRQSSLTMDVTATDIAPGAYEISLIPTARHSPGENAGNYNGCFVLEIKANKKGDRTFPGGKLGITDMSVRSGDNRGRRVHGTLTLDGAPLDGKLWLRNCQGNTIGWMKDYVRAGNGELKTPWK